MQTKCMYLSYQIEILLEIESVRGTINPARYIFWLKFLADYIFLQRKKERTHMRLATIYQDVG
ncbi:hypothetical protein BH11PSE12_BH11PSE12_27350 [soil metagenome]